MYEAVFEKRPNRFVIKAKLCGQDRVIDAYCPNTSRLIGLLDGSPRLLLTKNDRSDRKTNFTVRCIEDRGHWVGIQASKANDLLEQFLESDPIPPFDDWTSWSREVTWGSSQFDFRGETQRSDNHWVEVKSLSSRGRSNRSAFFSGTPSKRGWRHLKELGDIVEHEVQRASCVFVVQRSDVVQLASGEPTHPDWYEAIKGAHDRGVGIYAFRCARNDGRWHIRDPIPVIV